MTHEGVTWTLALNVDTGGRRERRMQVVPSRQQSEAPSAGASGSLACPTVFLFLIQESRHCLSVGSVLLAEQRLAWVRGEALATRPSSSDGERFEYAYGS